MAKICTVYGPRRPDDSDVKDFLDFARSMERVRRKTEDKKGGLQRWKTSTEIWKS